MCGKWSYLYAVPIDIGGIVVVSLIPAPVELQRVFCLYMIVSIFEEHTGSVLGVGYSLHQHGPRNNVSRFAYCLLFCILFLLVDSHFGTTCRCYEALGIN